MSDSARTGQRFENLRRLRGRNAAAQERGRKGAGPTMKTMKRTSCLSALAIAVALSLGGVACDNDNDLEDKVETARLAQAANMKPAEFKEMFGYLIEHDRRPHSLPPMKAAPPPK